MGRKVFQDFAHVLCQKFVETPSNEDLATLAILGDGTLALDIFARKQVHNRAPIDAPPYVDEIQGWLTRRLDELRIAPTELVAAALIVEYTVRLFRKRETSNGYAAPSIFHARA